MSPVVPPGEPVGTATPAEREARWSLLVRFALEAPSEAEAHAIIALALTSLDPPLPWQGEPAIAPLPIRAGIWAVTLRPDLTGLASIEPDDAPNRCRYVSSRFGNASWMPRATKDGARWDWPPDIWSRTPQDDVLLHPAVQAVMIWCQAQ